jgi:hypothetical protein
MPVSSMAGGDHDLANKMECKMRKTRPLNPLRLGPLLVNEVTNIVL